LTEGTRSGSTCTTRPIYAAESYRVAAVGDGAGRVGLLETEERAGGDLVVAPSVYGVSDLKDDDSFSSPRTSRAQRHAGRGNGLGAAEADDGEKQRERGDGGHDAL